MRRHAEHIDWLNFFCLIAELVEDGEVSCEAGGVAGDVDDAGGVHVGEGLEDDGGAAGSWRVDDDDIGADALVVEARHDIGGVSDEERRVLDVVVARVFPCVLDRGLYNLDAVDFAGFLRKKQRDRARAAVGIDDGFLAREIREFERFAVEHFGLRGVDLEERAR